MVQDMPDVVLVRSSSTKTISEPEEGFSTATGDEMVKKASIAICTAC